MLCLLLVKSPVPAQQMWNMFLIIMDQSSLFNSFGCHLDLLSYLMRLYVNPFAFSESLCREEQLWTALHSISQRQRVNSLPSSTMSYYRKTKVSGANRDAIKIVSLLTKRPNILHYVNKMWLVVHRYLIGGGCFPPGLFASDQRGAVGGGALSTTRPAHTWDGSDRTVQCTLRPLSAIFRRPWTNIFFSYHFLFLEKQEPREW